MSCYWTLGLPITRSSRVGIHAPNSCAFVHKKPCLRSRTAHSICKLTLLPLMLVNSAWTGLDQTPCAHWLLCADQQQYGKIVFGTCRLKFLALLERFRTWPRRVEACPLSRWGRPALNGICHVNSNCNLIFLIKLDEKEDNTCEEHGIRLKPVSISVLEGEWAEWNDTLAFNIIEIRKYRYFTNASTFWTEKWHFTEYNLSSSKAVHNPHTHACAVQMKRKCHRGGDTNAYLEKELSVGRISLKLGSQSSDKTKG